MKLNQNGTLTFIKTNFISILVLALVAVIFVQRYEPTETDLPFVVRDTVFVEHKNTIITKPVIIKTIPGEKEPQYIPDPNYEKLVKQYQMLVDLYTDKNIETDNLKLDSLGTIEIIDTVSKNRIKGRKVKYDIKIPIITKTITLPPLRTNQVYVGGGLQGGQNSLINQVNIGILYKTKNDKIFGIYTGMNTNGQIQVGLQTYWKIKLHK